jgi:hypothetical protein
MSIKYLAEKEDENAQEKLVTHLVIHFWARWQNVAKRGY